MEELPYRNGKNVQTLAPDQLDRLLDAALARFTEAEPREGLEERILATLKTRDVRTPYRAWWTFAFAAAMATFVIIAATIAWRSRPAHTPAAVHPSITRQAPIPQQWTKHEPNLGWQKNPGVRKPVRHRPLPQAVAANPKLDVFPSPLPLSEQEKLLAIYVSNNPERASLLAEARMNELRQEAEVRREIAAGKRDQQR